MKSDAKMSRVLNGEVVWPPPVWLMRQAGRYLPEYRTLRASAGSFWAMSNAPKIAAEATLQPIRRFGFDAAIIFSDILTVPMALGCAVTIEEGEGPRLVPITSANDLNRDETRWAEVLAPAYETIKLVRSDLSAETTLIGFAGAPWTLATYLAAGQGGDEQKAAKLWAYRDPEGFSSLLDVLEQCISFHLLRQLDAGADVVQLFDSWAQGLTEAGFDRWVLEPTTRIVRRIRAKYPHAKIIGFPRATTLAGYELYARKTGVDVLSLDTSAPLSWAQEALSERVAIQGNLDPVALISGGAALDESVDKILNALSGHRLIFNLGHGILPETPPEHVAQLVARVRSAA